MTYRKTWRYGAAIAGATLVLSGCGAFGEDQPAQRETLTMAFGLDTGEDIDWRAQDLQVQELIAVCMQEKGWEYIPVQYPEDWYTYEWDPSQERERIEREGLGIVYWTLYPDGTGEPYPGDDWVDPNMAYVDSLSQDEQQAYYNDLYGNMMMFPSDGVYYDVEWDEFIEPMPIDPGMGGEYSPGCDGQAWEEVNGDGQDQTVLWDAMTVFYDEIYARVEADPRIIELNNNWTQCMKDAGHDFRDHDDFWSRGWEELYERFEEIVPNMWIDPMEGWTEQQMEDFFANATDAEWEALYSNTQAEITESQRVELEALMAEEVALALADYDCSLGHWEKYEEISADVEETYIRENRAAIDEAVANAKG